MPVLKVYYDDTLDEAVRKHRASIQDAFEEMMRTTLLADPAKCQVILIATFHVTPTPVYVDMQFRANAHRTREVVSVALQEVADVLLRTLGAGVRIRAFDIDQAGLHAFESEGRLT